MCQTATEKAESNKASQLGSLREPALRKRDRHRRGRNITLTRTGLVCFHSVWEDGDGTRTKLSEYIIVDV